MIDLLKRTVCIVLGGALGFAAAALAQPAVRDAERPPNLVMIVADDLGYGDVCAYGCRDTKTPSIDALARSGARFTQAYVTAPVCSPSRAGLLTGRYQQRFGHEFNPAGAQRGQEQGPGMPPTERILPEYLKQRGYSTGMVGKWHLGSIDSMLPTARGFDEFFGFLPGANLYLDPLEQEGVHFIEAGPRAAARSRGAKNPILRGTEPVTEPSYLTDAFTREAVSFIEHHRDEPFFLYVAYNAPHTPFQTTDRYYDRFAHIEDESRRIYAAMVSALDDGVGAIVEALERHDLGERTLVVFLSDNGCATYTESCSNGPLLGGKVTPFEGGIRVPLIASWKATIDPGRAIEAPVSMLDLLPTALAIAGAPAPDGVELDGESLLPLLRGEAESMARDTLAWRYGDHAAVRRGDWKLVQLADYPPMLFDLASDPGERANRAEEKPEVVAELQRIYRAWDARNAPPLWKRPDDLWAPLQDILEGKPVRFVEGPGPGVLRF